MGATGDEFCLRWNDFEANISSAFRHLRSDEEFYDISLACRDPVESGSSGGPGSNRHRTLKAHKVILSSCSPYFRNLLRDLKSEPGNFGQIPFIVMRGVSYQQLSGILDFMYYGEANVAQEELDSFLALAEELQVKGLTQSKGGGGSNGAPPRPPEGAKKRPPSQSSQSSLSAKKPKPAPTPSTSHSDIKTEDIAEDQSGGAGDNDTFYEGYDQDDSTGGGADYEDPGEGTSGYNEDDKALDVLSTTTGVPADAARELAQMNEKEYQARVKSLIVRDTETGNHVCSFCSKTSKMADVIATHIEGIHLRLGRYPCKYCGKVFNTRCANVMHVRKKHQELSLMASAFGDSLANKLATQQRLLAEFQNNLIHQQSENSQGASGSPSNSST